MDPPLLFTSSKLSLSGKSNVDIILVIQNGLFWTTDYFRKVASVLHDNAIPHIPIHTVESNRQLNFEVLKHPLFCPGLASSDYHLFHPLKDPLRDSDFANNQEVKNVEHQSKTFYEGTQKLVDRWTE